MASGREWQGAQFGESAAELVLPGLALWQMQGEAALFASDASGQGEEAPQQGFGGRHRLAQTDARGPAGEVVGHYLYGQPGGVGWEVSRACRCRRILYLK